MIVFPLKKARHFGLFITILALALSLAACERSEESFRAVRNGQATNPYATAQNNAALIKRLEAAKEIDESQANRPDVSAVGWQDDMIQEGKADKAIRELAHGIAVPESQLKDALWVPPASQSGTERDRLIRQVQQAIQKDQHEQDTQVMESTVAALPYPVNTVSRLQERRTQAEAVLKDLKMGEDVHWSSIKEATQVPAP
jgi:hypothetical protein